MTVDRTITNSVGSDSEMLDELRKIRALLEPKPAPPAPPPPKGFVKEFKMFLEQYKVMGMAVAFILGLYLGTLGLSDSGKMDLLSTSPLLRFHSQASIAALSAPFSSW